MRKKLPKAFYTNHDVIAISQALLGKFLVTKLHANTVTAGMIVETEAYRGPEKIKPHMPMAIDALPALKLCISTVVQHVSKAK